MVDAAKLLGAHVDAWMYHISSTFQNVWAKLIATGSMFFSLHIAGFYGDEILLAMIFKLMLVDLAVGIWDAKKNETWSSYRFLIRGAVKFPLYAAYIFLVANVDTAVQRVLGVQCPIVELFCLYLISGEVYSIARHLKYIGFKVPELLLWLSFGFKKSAEQKIKDMVQSGKQPASEASDTETTETINTKEIL